MPRASSFLAGLALAAVVVAGPVALAADAGKVGAAAESATGKPAGSLGAAASSASSARAAGALPGASASSSAPAEELPAGHPSLDPGNPHAGGGGGGGGAGGTMPGVFNPPDDTEQPDATLPPGTIVVELRDADDKPVPHEQVNLGVLINSIAKGDSRKHLQADTDAAGRVTFGGLEQASNVAYRVSAGFQGGAFAATPFQLAQAKAMRVVLHVYPVTRDIQQALIVTEATVACEVREDRIQVEQALTIYNLGKTAWQPSDVKMPLPDGATAFGAQASMSDQGVDEAGHDAKLRGTFPPGRHAVEYRWQLPWSGDKDVDFSVGLPPHVAIARVMMPATSDIKLVADGFPPSEARHDQQGQSFLVTERRMRPDEPKLASVMIGIHDLPTRGLGPVLAALLAACGVAVGFVLAFGGRGRARGGNDGKGASGDRGAILADLFELELAHDRGLVGPKTYERARRELIDALARALRPATSSGSGRGGGVTETVKT